jgi:hypothetical protein
MRSTAPLDTRLYRAALHLYPPAFRRDFSQEIVRVFDEAREETLLTRPEDGLWGFRARMIADLARTIVRQWLRTVSPYIAVLSILYPLTAASALSSLWSRLTFVLPRDTADADADVLMLELLAAIVLLVVATTIILTLWFTRPLLYRRRR